MKKLAKTEHLSLFKEEVSECIHKVTAGVLALERDPANREIILELQRQTHTIKGTALLLGFGDISQIGHSLEDSFSALLDGKLKVAADFIEGVFTQLDALKDKLEHLVKEEIAFLKIPLKNFEKLSVLSLDISQQRKRLKQGWENLKGLSFAVQQLQKRSSDVEVEKLRNGVRVLLKEFGDVQDRFDILIEELLKSIQMLRLIPLPSILEDFPRIIRDIAVGEKKKVELVLDLGSVGIDKFISEEIKACLVHILRNAIRHGIEITPERIKVNKPPVGIIKIIAGIKANAVLIKIEDDGRGIVLQLVKEVVLKKGLLDEAQLGQMSNREIVKLILLPGFSSSTSVDELSGRGIGLDAARESIERLGGGMDIESEEGKYTRVSLSFPLTVSLISSILVEEAEQTFAIPLSFVDRSFQITPSAILTQNEKLWLKLDSSLLALVELGKFLNLPVREERQQNYPPSVVVIKSGGKSCGLIINRILEERELILKGFGNFLGKIKFLSGATILPEGKICLILDVLEILNEGTTYEVKA